MPLPLSRRLLPLLLTQALGAFQDHLVKTAVLAAAVFGAAGMDPGVAGGLAGTLLALPFLLLSGRARALADRLDKAAVARATKALEIPAAAVATAGFLVGSPWLLFGAVLLLGIQSALFSPAKYGLLPAHLSGRDLLACGAVAAAGMASAPAIPAAPRTPTPPSPWRCAGSSPPRGPAPSSSSRPGSGASPPPGSPSSPRPWRWPRWPPPRAPSVSPPPRSSSRRPRTARTPVTSPPPMSPPPPASSPRARQWPASARSAPGPPTSCSAPPSSTLDGALVAALLPAPPVVAVARLLARGQAAGWIRQEPEPVLLALAVGPLVQAATLAHHRGLPGLAPLAPRRWPPGSAAPSRPDPAGRALEPPSRRPRWTDMDDPLSPLRARLASKTLDPDLRNPWIPTAPHARRRILDAARRLAGERGESVDLLTLAGACGIAVEESPRLAPAAAAFTERPGPLLLHGPAVSRLSLALLLAGAALWPEHPEPLRPGPLGQDPTCLVLALDLLAPATALQRLRPTPEETARRFRIPLPVALVRLRALDLPPPAAA